jgi:hypothetical protein
MYLGSTKLKASTNGQKFFLGGIQWNNLSDLEIPSLFCIIQNKYSNIIQIFHVIVLNIQEYYLEVPWIAWMCYIARRQQWRAI